MIRKFILALCMFSFSFANIDALLDSVVLGSYSAKPRTIKTSKLTTFAGPSLSFRLRTDLLNKPLFYLQPPRATLSCAGLDFDAGWLSIMNLDTLSQMLQQAGASFMWGIAVGLVYSLPGIADAFDKLQKWGRYIQFLASNACQIGIQAGRGIYTAMKEGIRAGTVNETISQGVASTVSSAIKNYKQYIDANKVFGVYPYKVYYQSFSDKDLADLIASVTGVYLFYPMDDNGNVCTNSNCYDNVKVNVLPPLAKVSIKELINGTGGKIEVYDCSWGVLSNGVQFCTNVDKGKLPTRQISFTKGLKDLEREYLESILSKVESGGSLTASEQLYIQSSPIQNLLGILNTLAMYKKLGKDDLAQQALDEIAYLSAALKLQALIKSILYAYSSLKYSYANELDVPVELLQQIDRLDEMETQVDNYVLTMLDKIARLNQTFEVFEKQRRYITEKIMAEFGLGLLSK